MKTQTTLAIAALVIIVSCKPDQEQSPPSFAPKVVEAHGYVVPKDSMAEPQVIPAGKLRVVRAGKPKVVLINTNVHQAGIPRVVTAGLPRVCTPGQDSFSLPKTVPAIDSPFIAGIPEVVIAKEAYTKEHSPQNFSSFGQLQGLKATSISGLVEDKNGNLWISTFDGGVSKYDGKSFTHFTIKEGLSNNHVWSMLGDKNGNLWFGTIGFGVSKYDGKSFTHFTVKEGLSDNNVWTIHEDKSGNLWFGTGGGGMDRYDGKSFTHFSEKEGFSDHTLLSMVEDKSGNLWFGTEGGGLSKYDGKSFTHFTKKEGLSSNVVTSILEDKKGNLWFGSGGGLCKYDRKNFTHFTEKDGLSNNVVNSILEDKRGNLWFGTEGGVSKYDGTSFTHFTEKEGLSNNSVSSILEDKRGNLWFGTEGGVSKYGGKMFTHFTKKEALINNWVTSILEDKRGSLWFGTSVGGVSKYDGKSFTHFTEKEGLRGNIVMSILEDKSSNLWFGGLNKYDGKSFTHFTEQYWAFSMLEDKSGHLWFGTWDSGVSKYDGESFTRFTIKEGLSSNNVMSILQDKKGTLWFGTYGGGLSKYDGKNFTHFTKKEGLSNNIVSSIVEDKSGNLWFGTGGGGVSKYDGKTFTHFTEKEGLSNSDVKSILEDKSGNLWFGTAFGLTKLEKNKLASLTIPIAIGTADKSSSHLSESGLFFKTYTYEDGFSGINVRLGKTIYEGKDSTIWIGAGDGLTAFQPGEETPDTIAPNIQLSGLDLFSENIAWQDLLSLPGRGGHSPDNYREEVKDTSIVLGNGVRVHDFHFDGVSKWYGVPQNLSLAYNNNYLTFQFVGITLQSPKKVKYQYKLEGLDQNWSALTNRTEAPYGNLPHGKYTFKVKAMNGNGYWSNEFNYSFTIRPPWWYTWWAYCLYGLLLIAAAWSTHRYQKKRIIRIEQQKAQKKELEHAKEIEKAYNELQTTQAQLVQREKMASLGELTAGIAHEIQNPLNFINNFSEVNEELLTELKDEMSKGKIGDALALANDAIENQKKINHHGKRADAIVKGMLQHSLTSSGQKELTDINTLADEYLRLAYHGLRAKDKSFNAKFETDFDKSLEKINVVPQDIGRVILNLINNAFYSVSEKQKQQVAGYEPIVTVSTRKVNGKVEIKVKDNGNGIPQKVLDKIFQPFFTTKPTGQGTGLGLSLSYDIVKANEGELKVETKEGEFAEFIIRLPMKRMSNLQS